MGRFSTLAVVAVGYLVAPAVANAGSLTDVRDTIGSVKGSLVHRYDARDDKGAPLDGLDVVQAGREYVGVYHTGAGPTFTLQVATSKDMVTWIRRATLDADSSQGTLERIRGGGFVVAYEKAFSPLPVSLLWTSQLRFRAYPDLDRLLSGRQSAEFTAPRRLGLDAEGTPNIDWVHGGPDPSSLMVAVGFHYYADLDADGSSDVDRRGSGTLVGFDRWVAVDAPLLNARLMRPPQLHPGFKAMPSGNIGDRDIFEFRGRRMAIDEVQYVRDDFGSWRLFLRDPATARILPFRVRTAGASRAFGNPSVTPVTTPGGRSALFVSVFLFSEGAAAGEKGPLLYVAGVRRRR